MERNHIPLGLLWEGTCESTRADIGQLATRKALSYNCRIGGHLTGTRRVVSFETRALDGGTNGDRLTCMCFTITPGLREYFHYHGISADLERRGLGSSRPELAWAIRQKQQEPEKPVDHQNMSVKSSSSIECCKCNVLLAS